MLESLFNLGNGNGFSVKDVIDVATEVTGRKIPVQMAGRRAGDSPILVGSSDKARQSLGWIPQSPELQDIVSHPWQWHQKRHG
ncbi:hypothetical protein [Phormidium yuhuli]|uniref:hypothetical protein n=1 Tax=Phormidium yuhuli TaxID=2974039 RepID=UPI0028681D08|nr:hypothetical protein [Phormidium yuhuli]